MPSLAQAAKARTEALELTALLAPVPTYPSSGLRSKVLTEWTGTLSVVTN